jgi:hypothetical protein
VPLKSREQLDLQALHRVRQRLVGERTAVINQIRGFILEHGITVRAGPPALRRVLPEILANQHGVLSPGMAQLLMDLDDDRRRLDERIEELTRTIEEIAKGDEGCRRLMTIPGIGPIVSSAMVAAIGDGAAFVKARDFGAWLGLVPKQVSTGDRTLLRGISKRGNRYLRTMSIQGARSVLLRRVTWANHSFGRWLEASGRTPAPPQRAGGGARQQARPDRLERADAGGRLHTDPRRSTGVDGPRRGPQRRERSGTVCEEERDRWTDGGTDAPEVWQVATALGGRDAN